MNDMQSAIILIVTVYILTTLIAARFTARSAKVGILKIIWEKPSFWIVFWPITIFALIGFGILAALTFSCLAFSRD